MADPAQSPTDPNPEIEATLSDEYETDSSTEDLSDELNFPRRPTLTDTPELPQAQQKRYVKFVNQPTEDDEDTPSGERNPGEEGQPQIGSRRNPSLQPQATGDQIQRPTLTKTPELSQPPQQRYIKFVNELKPDEEEDTSGYGLNSDDEEDETGRRRNPVVRLPTDGEDARQPIQGSATPVFTRARIHTKSYRGPNLNDRLNQSLRISGGDLDDDEFDWTVPTSLPPPPPDPTPPPPPPPPPPKKKRKPKLKPAVVATPPPEEHDVFMPPEEVVNQKALEYDEEMERKNAVEWSGKTVTKWVRNVVVKTTQRASYAENTEQLQQGLKVVETITEKPLNKFLSALTTLIPWMVFVVSLTGSMIELIRTQASNAEFNISCFVFDLIEITFMSIIILVKRLPWYSKLTQEKRDAFEKKKQIIDNILAETLIYPTLMCALIGVATGRNFEPEHFLDLSADGHMGRLDLFMITFDTITLAYIYITRMYIVHKFMKNLRVTIPSLVDKGSCCSVITRVVYTIGANILVFGMMTFLLAIQVYHENLDANKPPSFLEKEEAAGELVRVTAASAYMMAATVVVPLLSIAVFAMANYYYILEFMIKVNLHVVRDEKFRSSLDEYGDVAQGVVGFAEKNVHATPGRLRDIHQLTMFQRLFYVLREWWIDLVFFLWASIIVAYCYLIYQYIFVDGLVLPSENGAVQNPGTTDTIYSMYVCWFLFTATLFLYANYHSFAIVFVTNIVILPLFVSYGIQALIDFVKKRHNKGVIKVVRADDSKLPPDEDGNRSRAQTDNQSIAKRVAVAKSRPVSMYSTRPNSKTSLLTSQIPIDDNEIDLYSRMSSGMMSRSSSRGRSLMSPAVVEADDLPRSSLSSLPVVVE